jgi:predicted DNA-binding transcriptional regulator AlpA
VRLLSKAQVLDRVPVTFPTLWAWMRAGKFPRARIIGSKSCWVESEVEAWIAARPLRRLKGDAADMEVT